MGDLPKPRGKKDGKRIHLQPRQINEIEFALMKKVARLIGEELDRRAIKLRRSNFANAPLHPCTLAPFYAGRSGGRGRSVSAEHYR